SQCRACPCNVYGVAVRFAYGQLKPLVWVLIGRVFCSGNFLDVVDFSFVLAGTCWQWCIVRDTGECTGVFPVDICKLTAANLVAGCPFRLFQPEVLGDVIRGSIRQLREFSALGAIDQCGIQPAIPWLCWVMIFRAVGVARSRFS